VLCSPPAPSRVHFSTKLFRIPFTRITGEEEIQEILWIPKKITYSAGGIPIACDVSMAMTEEGQSRGTITWLCFRRRQKRCRWSTTSSSRTPNWGTRLCV